MSFTKKYLGNGKQIDNLDIIRMSFSKKMLLQLIESNLSIFEEEEYLIFEIARKKEADKYGRTHHAYINVKSEEPAPKTSKKRKRA